MLGNPLDRTVQFRALSPGTGKNKTRKVAIPLDMIAALKWDSANPIRIEFVRGPKGKGELRLTSVKAEEYGLVLKYPGPIWKYDL